MLEVSVVRLNQLAPTDRRELELASAGGIVEGNCGAEAMRMGRPVSALVGLLGISADPAPRD